MVDNNHKSEDKSLILVERGGTLERVFAIKATIQRQLSYTV